MRGYAGVRVPISGTGPAMGDDVLTPNYRAQRLATRESEIRLAWAIAVAQGSGLLALAGIIGNVPDPNAALLALRWPLGIFGLGMFAALTAIQRDIIAASVMQSVALAEDRADYLLHQSRQQPIDVFQPVDFSGAELIYGDRAKAEDEFRKFMLGRLQYQSKRFVEHDVDYEKNEKDRAGRNAEYFRARKVANNWQSASIGLGIAGVIWIVLPMSGGIQKPVAAPKVVTHDAGASNFAISPPKIQVSPSAKVDQTTSKGVVSKGPLP